MRIRKDFRPDRVLKFKQTASPSLAARVAQVWLVLEARKRKHLGSRQCRISYIVSKQITFMLNVVNSTDYLAGDFLVTAAEEKLLRRRGKAIP